MFKEIKIGNEIVSPAFSMAPMAGVTHSAFRRLLAEFGGFGTTSTEMLAGTAVLNENINKSPYTKKRDIEKRVYYQFQFNGEEEIEKVIEKTATVNPFGIDLNLGCPAPNIRKRSAGAHLLPEHQKIKEILTRIKSVWNGPLTIKCRLGIEKGEWQENFKSLLDVFHECSVNAITVHPRFAEDKLKRKVNWQHFEWIKKNSEIPLIGNGDITDPALIKDNPEYFSCLDGLMIGRAAVVQPWIFQKFHTVLNNNDVFNEDINYAEIWNKFYNYVIEDFRDVKVLGKLKEFTGYYSRNFYFSNTLFTLAMGTKSSEELHDKANAYFLTNPQLATRMSFTGL